MTALTPEGVAEHDARRLAQVLREIGGDGAPINSGWMACDIPGSWADYAAGLGLSGTVSDQELDDLEAFYDTRERPCRVQVTPFQHPSLMAGLERRGFKAIDRDSVLVHPLDALPDMPTCDGLTFREVDPNESVDIEAFCTAQGRAFFPDGQLPEGMHPISRRVAAHRRSTIWLVERDERLIASGGIETFKGSSVLFAGGVAPEARRRGVHSALITHRLHFAKAQGFNHALIASVPGGPTERNAQRLGFSLVYTHLLFERHARTARAQPVERHFG
ncbi:MAG: GNAT family N-acetyltransferase [Myxococcota bacterium]